LLAAVKQRASVVARLSNHLPRGEYLRQLSCGLVVGKFSHALADVARPRLEQEDNASVVWSGIQVALNNVARSITSRSRTCSLRPDLRAQTGWWSRPSRPRRGAVFTKPRRQAPLLGQEDSHSKEPTVGEDRADRGPSAGGATPSSPMRPTCGTGRPRSARQPRRQRQKRRHQTLPVSPHFSPAGRDSPPAARGVFPAGCGASPAGRGAYPRGRRQSPLRSMARHLLHGLRLPSSLLLSPPCSAAAMRNKQDFF
jgi:hypothetical protein